MKIYYPFPKQFNLFLDEIHAHLNYTFEYCHYYDWQKIKGINIVSIHWPEAMVDWVSPTDEKLDDFKAVFFEWKKKFKIIYTRHNIYPHYHATPGMRKLYDFIAENVDAVVHLGNYSVQDYKKRYPNTNKVRHEIINHPLYSKFLGNISQQEARKRLKIPANKKVLLVFGAIRSEEEQRLIQDAYSNLDIENKYLLISNVYNFRVPKVFRHPRLKYRYINVLRALNKLRDHHYCNQYKIPNEDVKYYLSAADVLFIPRLHLLNSGNVYLAYTFNKKLVAPMIGNITENILENGNFGYQPDDKQSVVSALEQAFRYNGIVQNFEIANKTMNPEIVANKVKNLFSSLVNG